MLYFVCEERMVTEVDAHLFFISKNTLNNEKIKKRKTRLIL